MHATNETNKISLKNFFGAGNHQTRTNPAISHRKPLINKGGNCSIPGFEITKPNPHKHGTDIARNKSFIGISNLIIS